MKEKVGKLIIDDSYDVPYLAGYNTAGTIIYWDRKVPKLFPIGKNDKDVDIVPYVALHEAVEQHIESMFGLKYGKSHLLAMGAERAAVEESGLNWDKYDKHFHYWVEKCRNEFSSLPPDLDMQPYTDSNDEELLKKMKVLQSVKIKAGPGK